MLQSLSNVVVTLDNERLQFAARQFAAGQFAAGQFVARWVALA
jgi:hypothetical protein